MTTIQNMITDAVKTAFLLAGYDQELGKVSVSNRPDLCEYQCNGAMAGAKRYKKRPVEIAESVAAELRGVKMDGMEMFSSAEVCPPGFLNLKLHPLFLSRYLNHMRVDKALGLDEECGGKTVIVDYGGANVAKPLHVGHLRSAVIGECIKRMSVKMGNKTVGDVHLGDWGLQMGLIIAELKERGRLSEAFTISELEEIYPAASFKAHEKDEKGDLKNPSFALAAHEATRQLQEGNPEYRAVWERIMKVSVQDLKKNYDALDVHFDLWKGESDVQPYIPGLIEDLREKGLAYESDGALVVNIAEPGDSRELPPCMIRKSDGAALYATSDLGTILEREKLYHPDKYIYIADSRQSLHYTQFFRVARKAAYVRPETELVYIGFGTMNGKDGKPFKTREGGILRLETLIGDINRKVMERMSESDNTDAMDMKEKEGNARLIGLAALKYGDLSNQASKDYVFDIDKFTAFEGNTGPYILYTMVRISSILRKYAEKNNIAMEETASFIELHRMDYRILPIEDTNGYALQGLLGRYQDELKNAWKELAPHKLCGYIYEISNAFNSFYHSVKILSEEDGETRNSYLATLMLAWKILNECIWVLGFAAPERM